MESNADSFVSNLFTPKDANGYVGGLFKGLTPPNVANAQKKIGEQSDNGMCQRFVSDVSGDTQRYPSAIAAWNAQMSKAVPVDQAQPGDRVYFSADPSNNGDGHVGIYEGDGKFISATNNGVKSLPIADWQKQTRQQVLGVIPKE